MYVTRVPNRGSPPAVLLRESYREDGKVRTRTLANLSRWPEHKVEKLSRALKGLPAARDLSQAFDITRSLPHGHVVAAPGSGDRDGGGPSDRPGLQTGYRARAPHPDLHQLARAAVGGGRL